MMWYRTALQLPPNSSNLLVWMDANDITEADGASVTSMPNKGTLGGSWTNPENPAAVGGQTILKPLATTIDGKRALSFPTVWPPNGNPYNVTTRYGYPNSSFIFPSISAVQGMTMVTIVKASQTWNYSSPINTQFVIASAGGGYGNINVRGGNVSFPSWNVLGTNRPQLDGYSLGWEYPISASDTPIYHQADAVPQVNSDFGAIGTKISNTITNHQSFFVMRKNAISYSRNCPYSVTSPVGTVAGQSMIGGDFGGGTYSLFAWQGWIREVLIWDTVVSDVDIKSYLANKYGGSW